jgi:Zn-dependent peptidase ImmA (M78 family)
MTARSAVSRAKVVLAELEPWAPPIPVEVVARRLGLEVIRQQLPRDTSAVIVRSAQGRRVIGVNSQHSDTRQRFSIAHEIGHALLHLPSEPPATGDAVVDRPLEVLFRDDLASMGVDAREIEANAFAAELLMPEAAVRDRFRSLLLQSPQRGIEAVLSELAQVFDVSVQAMGYRLNNLGLIDPT